MKLYLASILEPENFGPGRLVGVANGNKPYNINIVCKYDHLTPKSSLQEQYYSTLKEKSQQEASEGFVNGFVDQLNGFYNKVMTAAKSKNVSVISLLPFQDGDTLVSWERKANTHYRGLIAEVLKKLGYEIIEN